MDRVVHKFAVPDGEGSFSWDLPAGAQFAGLVVQDNEPYMYFIVDPATEYWRYVFHARDTGQPLDVGEDPTLFQYLGNYSTRLLTHGYENVRHVWMEV